MSTWRRTRPKFLCPHYYENRMRPRYAYAMGWIHRWARLASFLPGVSANALSADALGETHRGHRACNAAAPRFASVTFKEWFQRRGAA